MALPASTLQREGSHLRWVEHFGALVVHADAHVDAQGCAGAALGLLEIEDQAESCVVHNDGFRS